MWTGYFPHLKRSMETFAKWIKGLLPSLTAHSPLHKSKEHLQTQQGNVLSFALSLFHLENLFSETLSILFGKRKQLRLEDSWAHSELRTKNQSCTLLLMFRFRDTTDIDRYVDVLRGLHCEWTMPGPYAEWIHCKVANGSVNICFSKASISGRLMHYESGLHIAGISVSWLRFGKLCF